MGVTDRYEVWAQMGHLDGSAVSKNVAGLYDGFRTTYFDSPVSPKKTGVATLLGKVTGESGSDVAKLYERIVSSLEQYPLQCHVPFMAWSEQ